MQKESSSPFRGANREQAIWGGTPERPHQPRRNKWTDGGLRGASALLMLLFSIAISFVALLTPPPGVIDPSVLWLVAQALLFAASAFGLDAFIRQMTDHHNKGQPLGS